MIKNTIYFYIYMLFLCCVYYAIEDVFLFNFYI